MDADMNWILTVSIFILKGYRYKSDISYISIFFIHKDINQI